ncbi:MAG TPA: serine hydrolase domain-containing protein [Planctomycetia bacterium]|nr:serine hydrolase domain-containing protein [Planctomycetia bacterium]
MKRLSLTMALIGAWALFAPGAARGQESMTLPDTPAGKQVKRYLEVLASGDKNQLKKFIEENFAASFMRDISVDQHLEVNAGFAEQAGGVTPRKVVSSSPTQITLLGAARKGGTPYRVSVAVEATPPHKLTNIGFRRPEPSESVEAPPTREGDLTQAELAAWTQEYVERLVKADAFSGAVLIAYRDQTLFARAAGLASRAWNQPNRTDTRFNLGSMNKMFTSIAIAQLVEKGKVALDDPIVKHLPDYPNADAAKKVTVRHLLSHTSGLADYFNDKFMKASRDRFRKIEDYFPLFTGEKLQFEPGTRFRYSNAGFMVLGAIVQRASGMDYFDYVRQHIYQPAGMTGSDCFELDTDVPNLAVGYTRGPGNQVKNNLFMHVIKGGPAGGGYSTVEDLHRFAIALCDGKLIRADTLKQWTTPGEKNARYAFGFQVSQVNQTKLIGHSGGFPGINSVLTVDLENGYVIAVMSNSDSGAAAVEEKLKQLLPRVKR